MSQANIDSREIGSVIRNLRDTSEYSKFEDGIVDCITKQNSTTVTSVIVWASLFINVGLFVTQRKSALL